MAKVVNNVIYLRKGDTEQLSLTMKDSSGTTIDFVIGDVITLTVKQYPTAESAILTVSKTIDSSYTSGAYVFTIGASEYGTIAPGQYTCDIQRTSGEYKKTIFPPITTDTTMIEGTTNWKNLVIVPEVTTA